MPQMLYFCALDAQSQGKKELGFSVLWKIIKDYDEEWMTDEAKSEIRLPVLLRYMSSGLTDKDVLFGSLTPRWREGRPIQVTSQCSVVNFRLVVFQLALTKFSGEEG